MRLIHLADLHIGKDLGGFSLIEDQKYILDEILGIVDEKKADAVMIAGDIYDRQTPSREAVDLMNSFLTRLSETVKYVFMVSGNHDSAGRIAFGGDIFSREGIFISGTLNPSYDEKIFRKVTVEDDHGEIDFYLLPFIKPYVAKQFFEDEDIKSYDDAAEAAVRDMDVDTSRRSVLVAHQFVTGAESSGSEEMSIGGSENIDGGIFSCFDYVALGHLHMAQKVGRDSVRYAGSPLKYSFSAAELHQKSVTLVDIGEKGDVRTELIPLEPMRDLKIVRGTLRELISPDYLEKYRAEKDFFKIVMTDSEIVPDAANILRGSYPNYVEIVSEAAGRGDTVIHDMEKPEDRDPLSLFDDFFSMKQGRAMDDDERKYMDSMIKEIWEDSDETR
ncbi:MAG: exonuclease SbcCD subunit D [Anaerovoracaceae bacterium]